MKKQKKERIKNQYQTMTQKKKLKNMLLFLAIKLF